VSTFIHVHQIIKMKEKDELKFQKLHTYYPHKAASRPSHMGKMTPTLILL
jgi:hypothetical protein